MERRELPETTLPETNIEGRDRRTPVGKRRESGERAIEKGFEPPRYFDVENRVAGTPPEFAVRSDPQTGLVVLVDGRDAPQGAAAHAANGIFSAAERDLPLLMMEASTVSGNGGEETFRPRRIRYEDTLASASEHALAEMDLFRQHAELLARGDRETALEIPASAALAVVPEQISEEEIIGADKELAETLINQKALTADDKEWKKYVTPFQEGADQQKRDTRHPQSALLPCSTGPAAI